MQHTVIQVVLVSALVAVSSSQRCGSNVQFRNNSCLRGDKHSELPSPQPENESYAACHQWKDGACCTPTFTEQLAAANVINIDGFHWNRCGNLSTSCQRFFVNIECFYRCSPNVAHFERNFSSAFGNLPLCQEFCDEWFDACKNDQTCVTNWITDWVYAEGSGINVCPDNARCRTFRDVYKNSSGICNQLWGPSFFYSSYSMSDANRQCFIPYFPENSTNPNDVAVENIFFRKETDPAPSPCPAHLGGAATAHSLSLVIIVGFILAAAVYI